jgi:hypothetical protein
MFFEVPCGVFKAKVENPKLAKVTIEREVLTVPEIIEYMKRIVPSDKFHWEVYHYKDNIYRVKLPSKNEVQRLKNFGSYICPQKDTVMFFLSLVCCGGATLHVARSVGTCCWGTI